MMYPTKEMEDDYDKISRQSNIMESIYSVINIVLLILGGILYYFGGYIYMHMLFAFVYVIYIILYLISLKRSKAYEKQG